MHAHLYSSLIVLEHHANYESFVQIAGLLHVSDAQEGWELVEFFSTEKELHSLDSEINHLNSGTNFNLDLVFLILVFVGFGLVL